MREQITLEEIRQLYDVAYRIEARRGRLTYEEEFQAKALLFIAERLDRLTRP